MVENLLGPTGQASTFTHSGGSKDERNNIHVNKDEGDHTQSHTNETDDTPNPDTHHDIPNDGEGADRRGVRREL